MKLIINNENINLIECKSFKNRLLGNMFKKEIKYLLFDKCHSIHTFFMLDEIDVIFLDKNNKIIKTVSNLKPWKICTCKNGYKVIELPKNTLNSKLKIVD